MHILKIYRFCLELKKKMCVGILQPNFASNRMFSCKKKMVKNCFLTRKILIKTLFLYLNVCRSVMLDSLSCSFTFISFLIN